MNELPLYAIHSAPTEPPGQLVCLLHGFGSNEHDLFDLGSYFAPDCQIISFRAPIVLDGFQSFAWFEISITASGLAVDVDQALSHLTTLVESIQQASQQYQVPAERVILIGFSQGATMAALAGLTRPDLIGATAILSGIAPRPFLENDPDPTSLHGRYFLVTHGSQDTVVPITQGQATYEMLVELGARVAYREYPVGHGLSQDGIADLATWVQSIR